MDQIEKEVKEIEMRNALVEAEKAWETCPMRVVTISLITYTSTAIVFAIIGVRGYLLNALIPTTGFFVSTLSLPPIKKWWIRRKLANVRINIKEEI